MHLNIVILVSQRLSTFKRLVDSLLNAHIYYPINLIISCDGNVSQDVLDFAKKIKWDFGNYTVIQRENILGADLHNIKCMQMALTLEHILVLEDDLIISPYFTNYLDEILNSDIDKCYKAISLYRYPCISGTYIPFNLLSNDEFIFYQKRPSAKGCFYFKKTIQEFKKYIDGKSDFYTDSVPSSVNSWNDLIWEKKFYAFLNEKDSYVIFPKHSFSTDMGDSGVHMNKEFEKYVHQSQLYLSSKIGTLKSLGDAINVYDSCYELEFKRAAKLFPQLKNYSFEMDIHGLKNVFSEDCEFVITSRFSKQTVLSWGRRLKPEINNIIFNIDGNHYRLIDKKNFKFGLFSNKLSKIDFQYYFPDLRLVDLIKIKLSEIKSRIF